MIIEIIYVRLAEIVVETFTQTLKVSKVRPIEKIERPVRGHVRQHLTRTTNK